MLRHRTAKSTFATMSAVVYFITFSHIAYIALFRPSRMLFTALAVPDMHWGDAFWNVYIADGRRVLCSFHNRTTAMLWRFTWHQTGGVGGVQREGVPCWCSLHTPAAHAAHPGRLRDGHAAAAPLCNNQHHNSMATLSMPKRVLGHQAWRCCTVKICTPTMANAHAS